MFDITRQTIIKKKKNSVYNQQEISAGTICLNLSLVFNVVEKNYCKIQLF